MKLHKDGTIEGTPQEIAEYQQSKQPPIKEGGEFYRMMTYNEEKERYG